MTEQHTEEGQSIAEFGQRWSGWARILGTAIALAALLGVGTLFYDRVWQSKVLTYTVLPNYDLGDQVFSGLVIENRGRAPLHDIRVVLSDLGTNIEALNTPGAGEPIDVADGGEGHDNVRIEMPLLFPAKSFSIYMLTSEEIGLEQDRTLYVRARETAGVSAGESLLALETAILVAVAGALGGIVGSLYTSRQYERELERVRAVFQMAATHIRFMQEHE